MNITVYCGSSFGSDERFRQAATEFGTWIGENGHGLVYGGSCMGLMGLVADAVLAAGGTAIGVEPSFLIEFEPQHDGLTELIEVETMVERKMAMIERGDAFVALPGGVGTLEEISEIASRVRLELMDAPCIIYNVAGYYDEFVTYLQRMEREGFILPHQAAKIVVATTLDEVAQALTASR